MVNNFPLSHVIFKVNYPLSNDPLALVTEKRQQQRHNTGLSLKSTRLSSFIEFIYRDILLRVFHASWLFILKFCSPKPKPNYNSGTLTPSSVCPIVPRLPSADVPSPVSYDRVPTQSRGPSRTHGPVCHGPIPFPVPSSSLSRFMVLIPIPSLLLGVFNYAFNQRESPQVSQRAQNHPCNYCNC